MKEWGTEGDGGDEEAESIKVAGRGGRKKKRQLCCAELPADDR